VGKKQEASVRSLFASFEGSEVDLDVAMQCFASHAAYSPFPWQEPFVGQLAIEAELMRQAQIRADLEIEIVTMISKDRVAFAERLEQMTVASRRLTVHSVGVFEFDRDASIAKWRDYTDTSEHPRRLEGESGSR
jgi:limonene-1,2-epoxide hydrolase